MAGKTAKKKPTQNFRAGVQRKKRGDNLSFGENNVTMGIDEMHGKRFARRTLAKVEEKGNTIP